MLTASANKRGEDYESGWDLVNLQQVLDDHIVQQKDAESKNPNEKNRSINTGYIEFVTAFQRGIGANFYTFSPRAKLLLRTKQNKDPRGAIPIHYMYANMDFSNPIGRGAVEKSGGMQNLLDSEVQSYQYMRALLMNPPLEIKGNVPSTVLKYAPAAQWRVGADPAASITPVKLETASLEAFPANYGLIKSQIVQGNGADDNNATPASSGNTSSKTAPGVQAAQAKLGISDNYIRRQFEAVYEEIAETEINVYFAERSGIQVLQLDVMTADKIRDIDPTLVNEQNQVQIDYDQETEKLQFKVDPSSSNIIDDETQAAAIQQALTIANADPYFSMKLAADNYDWHPGIAYKELFSLGAIKSVDQIITEMPKPTKDAQGNEVPPKPTWTTPIYDKPTIHIDYKDLPPVAQQQVLGSSQVNATVPDVLTPNIDQIAGGKSQNPVHQATIGPNGQISVNDETVQIDPTTGQPVPNQTPGTPAPDATVPQVMPSAPGEALPIADNGGKADIVQAPGDNLPVKAPVAATEKPQLTTGEQPLPAPQNPEQAAAMAAMNPMNHPVLAAMKHLGIKPESLAPNQLAHVHQLIGLPATEGPTPDQSKHELEKIKAKHTITKDLKPEPVEPGEGTLPEETADAALPAEPGEPQANTPPDLNEHDIMLIDGLKKRGYNDQQIGTAIAMLKHGKSVTEIIAALHGGSLNG